MISIDAAVVSSSMNDACVVSGLGGATIASSFFCFIVFGFIVAFVSAANIFWVFLTYGETTSIND